MKGVEGGGRGLQTAIASVTSAAVITSAGAHAGIVEHHSSRNENPAPSARALVSTSSCFSQNVHWDTMMFQNQNTVLLLITE